MKISLVIVFIAASVSLADSINVDFAIFAVVNNNGGRSNSEKGGWFRRGRRSGLESSSRSKTSDKRKKEKVTTSHSLTDLYGFDKNSVEKVDTVVSVKHLDQSEITSSPCQQGVTENTNEVSCTEDHMAGKFILCCQISLAKIL